MATAVAKIEEKKSPLVIKPLNFETISLELVGDSPYVQLRMSEKTKKKMLANMESGEKAKNKKNREARNYQQEFLDAQYIGITQENPEKEWNGIPASCFRNAGVSASKIAGFVMTKTKMSIFVEADGFDKFDGTPLIKIEGKPHQVQHSVRNADFSTDWRTRAMWRNWKIKIRVRYDADQFTTEDVVNLFTRVGAQVGIGEGRPDSRRSCGMGWGTFHVEKVGK